MDRFTDLSDEKLGYYLKKIRRIAEMEDQEAIQEIDEWIYNLGMQPQVSSPPTPERESSDNEEDTEADPETVKNLLNDLSENITLWRSDLETDKAAKYQSRRLREQAGQLRELSSRVAEIKIALPRIKEVADEALQLAEDIDNKCSGQGISTKAKKQHRHRRSN